MLSLAMQCLLDGVLLALCTLGLFESRRGKAADVLVLPLVYAALCLVLRTCFCRSADSLGCVLLPADNFLAVICLLVLALSLNSGWFQSREHTAFWGTWTQFCLFLLLREICFLPLAALSPLEGNGAAALIGVRLFSLLLWPALLACGLFRWLREQLAEGSIAVGTASAATLAVLLLLWLRLCLWQVRIQQGSLWWAGAAALLGAVLLLDGGVLLWEQRRLREQQRIRLVEQYLPMVEELVESVRARQHAYRNQMMAVTAAVCGADSLETARSAVAALAGDAVLDRTDQALLRCDSKLISGLLYGKIRQAGLRHIQVETSLAGGFRRRTLPESSWAEILGVLLDNALEAASPDDTVYLSAEDQEEDGALRLTVSNPCPPKTSRELAEMFRRGYSTKAEHGRGYGLYNLRLLVERAGGRLVVRNEEREGRSYLTIGVIAS